MKYLSQETKDKHIKELLMQLEEAINGKVAPRATLPSVPKYYMRNLKHTKSGRMYIQMIGRGNRDYARKFDAAEVEQRTLENFNVAEYLGKNTPDYQTGPASLRGSFKGEFSAKQGNALLQKFVARFGGHNSGS